MDWSHGSAVHSRPSPQFQSLRGFGVDWSPLDANPGEDALGFNP
ncbi:hypothetical protein GFS31_43790 (plasmid) [Leptolyngbya sp. BL0902]|nr:hypothetical protein GFS31_43790 [Leptolyngbya sp. BL0902]